MWFGNSVAGGAGSDIWKNTCGVKKMKKDILKIILAALIAIFVMIGIGTIFLAGQRKKEMKELRKQEALQQLENIPTVTPTAAVTVTPRPATPTPSPAPTLTPTPVPTRAPAFVPDNFTGAWYSPDGLTSINIYDLTAKSVSFYFSQSSRDSGGTCEADVVAEVAGNASKFSFTDSYGSSASGNLIFDRGRLYVKISTSWQADGAWVSPDVDCVMQRERPQAEPEAPGVPATETPALSENQPPSSGGEYFFQDSDSRYLTDEELSGYSAEDLELAKNEIYARHGRKFVTDRIADYFEGKSWYQGTVDAETFDAMSPESVFNEYELANIAKIVEWEKKKRE